MVAEMVDYLVGVDTHRDEHTLALVEAATGALLARRTVASNGRGYAQALRFAQQQAGGARLWALEGAGHYGAGLARFLSERGETVLEVSRLPRGERRLRGKDDRLDAVRAARAALGSEPRVRAGPRRPVISFLSERDKIGSRHERTSDRNSVAGPLFDRAPHDRGRLEAAGAENRDRDGALHCARLGEVYPLNSVRRPRPPALHEPIDERQPVEEVLAKGVPPA
jgi:transposase